MQYAQQIMGGSPKSRGWQGPGTPVEPGHHPGPGPYPPGRHSRRRKNHSGSGFSRALGLTYGRVQFTPDVLPSDVTGYSVYNKETGAMTYQPGAVLCNLFLADELNRATSRTQSALLEAMEEGQVTVDGQTHPIPQPFTVIATQNRLEPPEPSSCQTARWTGSPFACPWAARLPRTSGT